MDTAAILAFSSLSWQDLPDHQRELLASLASKRRIYFIEEPVSDPALATEPYQLSLVQPNLAICRVSTPLRVHGFNGKTFPSFAVALSGLIKHELIEEYVAWLFTPLVLPMLQGFRVRYSIQLLPRAVVYYCQEDLSSFIRSPELLARDTALTRLADLVLVPTPEIYAQKHSINHHTHWAAPPAGALPREQLAPLSADALDLLLEELLAVKAAACG